MKKCTNYVKVIVMKADKTALIFFSYKSHRKGYIEMLFKRLNKSAKKMGVKLARGSLKDSHIYIKNNKLSIIESLTGIDIKNFGLIYFELWYKEPQNALAVAIYAKRNKTPFFSEELMYIMPSTKTGQLATLADNDLPIPDTIITSANEFKKIFKGSHPLTYPFVLKAADSYGGKNNYLIRDYRQLLNVLRDNKNVQFVAQEFIQNDCDYRCLVFGGQIKLVLRRTRQGQGHLNNTSQGAIGELVSVNTLSAAARRDILKAAKILNRLEFAGVDLVVDKNTGQHYILEINQTPQIEIGAEVDAKMNALVGYMKERLYGNEK